MINRYKQLLASIPKGQFYASDGQILPHRDTPYQIRITAGTANLEYGVFVNGGFRGSVVTNSQAIALVSVLLDNGSNEIKLVNSATQASTKCNITTRDYATLLAAEAEVLEGIDTGIEQVLADSRLETVSAALIEDVFGRTVGTANDTNYSLDVYREVVQELRTAYRNFGGTLEGMSRAVRAVTQISPLVLKNSFGPSWILGKDLISPKTNVAGHTYYVTTAPLTAAQGTGAGVSLVSVDGTVGVGTGSLRVTGNVSPKNLRWASSLGNYGPAVNVTANGDYTLYDGQFTPRVFGQAETYSIVSGANNKLALDVGGRGVITVTLTAGTRTAAQIATDINTAFNADLRYGAAYSTVASSQGPTNTLALDVPSGSIETISIYPITGAADGAQTLFNLPVVRAGLQGSHASTSTTLTLTAATVMTSWPTPSADNPVTLVVGRTTAQPPTGSTVAAASLVAPVTVTAIGINKTSKTITLASPGLVTTQPANASVEMVDQMPFVQRPILQARSIKVHVTNFALLPTTVTTDTFTISGSGVPDGWVLTTNAGGVAAPLGPVNYEYFDIARDLPIKLAPDRMLTIPIPDEAMDYLGMNLKFDVWGSPELPTTAATRTTISQLGMSFDGGGSYTLFSPTSSGEIVNSTKQPSEFSITTIIPTNATAIRARIKLSNSNGNFVIHRVRTTIPNVHDGTELGTGTIPYNEQKVKSGNLVYVWCKDSLTSAENAMLGTSTVDQSTVGHIDKLLSASVWLDKFNVTEFSGAAAKNVKGAFSDADFVAGAYNNMEIVLRTPTRFTYLKPTVINDRSENISWNLSNQFTLAVESDQDQTLAVIFEDGVPLLSTQWSFVNSTTVAKTTSPSATAVYTISYNALIRFETNIIDLGSTFADYWWLADYDAYVRPDIRPQEVSVSTGVQFDAAGVATLDDASNLDQSVAYLVEDTGTLKKTVPVSQWEYLDNKRIRVSQSIFNANALYTFTYMAQVNHPDVTANIKVELRSSATLGGITSAVYATVLPNHIVGNGFRYHQMRLTANGVIDTRDLRLQSMLLKGLNLFGAGGTVPVLRPD